MEKTRKIKGSVRTAVDADLPFIQEWLTSEARNGDGFINNWSVIQKACAEKQMTVFFTLEGPVGFLTYGISHGTILQTKSSCQQRGIGRKLVEHAIRKEEALNNTVLIVQCEPHSSVEFWSQMGFEVHRGAGDLKQQRSIYMQRLLKLAHMHVRGDALEMVTVCVYPETALNSKENVKPDRVHYVMAKFDEKTHSLELAHRVSIAHEGILRDPVVEVSWGPLDIVKGKVKHEQARAIGFKATPNCCGWYLDVITLNEIEL
ncbi:GNAT family N-acetyltransferase [Pseudomonas sp. PA-1-2A]|uniref:GNAT family N-acetyltransferase n=1 Tax=Pseudomonas TaxID=286 RepID=UPI001EEF9C19|nr:MULTISPECIES: GNAT family N-acetyltransferase [Pseudomonas]MCF5691278.1 GNAT family N-acetyltransferase [Pseudomonas sp. PA-1-8C]MCF5786280.1 GNAT family N-acetyltransferase [Pseudomonas sp. PA-1-6G]MCF5791996.1 GNAT family N-acetyltransferase [Pseudomonas sp. PA-1-6B]MCF5796179.1 GNAT family N-acetyltransferase [Pseudomonas sp. PA-1-5A]MCF5812755.1 GNAT family N-acetyltransferase [Pseudomonas sp. PA-1-2A]